MWTAVGLSDAQAPSLPPLHYLSCRVFPLGRPDEIQQSALYTSSYVRLGAAQKPSTSPFQAFADEKQQQDLTRNLHHLRVKGGSVLIPPVGTQCLCSFRCSFVV